MKKTILILILLIVSIFITTACQNNVVEETTTETVEVTTEAAEQISTITLPAPTFEYYASDKVVELENGPFTLSLISSNTNNVTDFEKWFTDNGLSMGRELVEDELGKIIEYSDGTYTYKILKAEESRNEWFAINPYKLLEIYSTETQELLYSLDFSNYIFLSDYNEEDSIYIKQNLVWAQIKDNVLYVSNSHNSYASETNNLNSFITALDLSDMSILWRSEPLVANTFNFAIFDDVLFCGYGYTDEADYLYQIDLNNGKVLDKISVNTSPEYIIVKDSILYVRCFDTDYQFNIVE